MPAGVRPPKHGSLWAAAATPNPRPPTGRRASYGQAAPASANNDVVRGLMALATGLAPELTSGLDAYPGVSQTTKQSLTGSGPHVDGDQLAQHDQPLGEASLDRIELASAGIQRDAALAGVGQKGVVVLRDRERVTDAQSRR